MMATIRPRPSRPAAGAPVFALSLPRLGCGPGAGASASASPTPGRRGQARTRPQRKPSMPAPEATPLPAGLAPFASPSRDATDGRARDPLDGNFCQEPVWP